jgi:hypothetical protein
MRILTASLGVNKRDTLNRDQIETKNGINGGGGGGKRRISSCSVSYNDVMKISRAYKKTFSAN